MYPDISESENFPLWIQKFPRPYGPDSLSVRQLICKANFASCEHFLFMLQMCHKHFFARLTCLRRPIRPYDIERSLRMSSRRLE